MRAGDTSVVGITVGCRVKVRAITGYGIVICILATLLARIDQQRRPLTELQSAERSKMAFSGDFTPVTMPP